MKTTNKNMFKLFSIFILMACVISCKDSPNTGNNNNEVVQAPDQIISVQQAKRMYDAYTNRRVGLIREFEGANPDGSQFNPTRYGWYDYETIKQYLAYIEQEADKAGVEISGIQFYLANYPASTYFPDGTPVSYPKQNSFFMVPTLNRDGEELGFLTTESANGGSTAVLMRDRVEKFKRGGAKSGTKSDRNKPKTKLTDGKTKKAGKKGGSKLLMINPGFYAQRADSVTEHSLILNEVGLRPPPNQSNDMDN